MKVDIRTFSTLRNLVKIKTPVGEPIEMDIEPGTTIRDILDRLELPHEEIAIILVDHNHKGLDYVIGEEDTRVSFFPLSGGG